MQRLRMSDGDSSWWSCSRTDTYHGKEEAKPDRKVLDSIQPGRHASGKEVGPRREMHQLELHSYLSRNLRFRWLLTALRRK